MPSLSGTPNNGREYWRSLNELADTPEFREFMHNEFPASASALLESGERRQFLKVMGASMALAGLGLAGCRRWPEEHIVPYAKRPAERTPGVPEHFATSMELGGVAVPLLATSSDGRPTKIEGNPEHPASRGASSGWAQASVLDMYDPDRSRGVLRDGKASTWSAFTPWADEHFGTLAANRGQSVAVLSEETSSPSVQAMRARFLSKFPNAKWHTYEPLSNDNELQGSIAAFGEARRAHYDFSRASVIVSFDADFLCHHPDAIRHTRGFAQSRSVDENNRSMSRLYVFDGAFSLTGANADHRAALKRSQVPAAAAWLAAKLAGRDATAVERVLPSDAVKLLQAALEDLQGVRGKSVVLAGPEQPPDVHLLVHAMNHGLSNVGSTVQYSAAEAEIGHVESLRQLVSAMSADQVSTLVIIGGNPIYNAPADLDFAAAIGKVASVIHLSEYVDETSAAAHWHINRAHYLESWGDGRSYDGTYTLQQPLIEPLFHGKTPVELLAVIVADELKTAQEIVKRTFGETTGDAGIKPWRQAVHDGFVAKSSAQPIAAGGGAVADTDAQAAAQRIASAPPTADGWEVVFTPDSKVYDGRFANNGWLQELPEPLTKLTWDNAAWIGLEEAESLGVEQGDLLSVTIDGRTQEIPALLMPAMPRNTIAVALGYGREMEGRVCHGAGVSAYKLRGAAALWHAANAEVRRGSGHTRLACTQDHHAIDTEHTGGKGQQNRLPMLFQEASLARYRADGNHAFHRPHVVHTLSLFKENHPFHREGEGTTHAWAMAVDLNACTGCSACVVACQAENNIPVVGKDQVLRGREMHWIRIDRYFKFHKTGKRSWDKHRLDAVALQPVLCMHCENAPCEQVCPVAATVHDQDGLNVMVYNRCVGTRYCSNNCPYKVRRFNYFDYHRRDPHREQPGALLQVDPEYYTKRQADPGALKALQFNPDVTVRNRGVMEKCTYCTQRINAAKIEAKNAWARQPLSAKQTNSSYAIPDGTITPACAQACPAEALVFGDLNDPTSRVHRMQKQNQRAYELLEELNVKARTKYLAKIRNTRGDLAGAAEAHDEARSDAGAGH